MIFGLQTFFGIIRSLVLEDTLLEANCLLKVKPFLEANCLLEVESLKEANCLLEVKPLIEAESIPGTPCKARDSQGLPGSAWNSVAFGLPRIPRESLGLPGSPCPKRLAQQETAI